MPRVPQYIQKYAEEDFRREVRIRQGYYELMSVRLLSEAVGIPRSTLGPKLKEPDKLEVADLRKLVKTLQPDPMVLLALLGYDKVMLKKAQAAIAEVVA